MSIQTEIDRIAGNVAAALEACGNKGVAVPSGSTSDDLPTIIAAIEAGGGGGGDLAAQIVERTVTELCDATIVSVGAYALYSCSQLTSVELPACTTVNNYAFGSCSQLTSVELPACTRAYDSAFRSCSQLTSVELPACLSVGTYAFGSCSQLTSVELPACLSVGTNAFNSCSRLTSVELPACTTVNNYAFNGCSQLTSVVLRSESVCKLSNINAFTKCYHILGTANATYNPDGLKDGYIYVPDALVEDYKVATNWSTYADQIKPLSEHVEVTA